ncbi:hypothetical protein ACTFIW_009609 [Dictyostelium discoideum]
MSEITQKPELIKYLSIIHHLGAAHIETINGFLQKPSYIGLSPPITLLPSGSDQKLNNDTLYQIATVLERMDDTQFDDVIFYLTKQLRQPLDPDEHRRLAEISLTLKVSPDYLSSIGRIYQSFQLFELLTCHCSEEHINKLKNALTSVFPLPMESTEDQDVLNQLVTPSKQKNYLSILEKLKQLFIRTRIDSILHIQSEMMEYQHNPSGKQSITQQHICDTLDIKSDEYYLATCLKELLLTDEFTLTSLADTFPKLQPLQLLQLSLLPFKNIYEILDLRINFVNLSSTYQIYAPLPNDLEFNYQLPNPNKLEVRIVEQPPEKAIYKRNVKPAPSVVFDGDSKLLNGNYYVHVALLRCTDFIEEPTFLNGASKPFKIGCGKVVTFKKLKILVTSHQQGETLFCFRFDLRCYTSDPETNPTDFTVVSSVQTNPISVLSHSTQLKSTAIADLPKVTEIFPLNGPATGGTRIALLGSNFADTPATRVKFGNTEVVPEFYSNGTLLCFAPEHAPGPVEVKVSNSANSWSVTMCTFTYDNVATIDSGDSATQQTNDLLLPKSLFGLDFSKTFDSSFIIKGLDSASNNLPSNSGAHRSFSTQHQQQSRSVNQLNHNGYAPIHYACTYGNQVLLEKILSLPLSSINCIDKHGNTGLHYAVIFGHFQLVQWMLRVGGASPNIQNFIGQTPLHLISTIANNHNNNEKCTLFIARELVKFGANVNIGDIDSVTPLHYSAAFGKSQILSFLLNECAVDLYCRDDSNETALHYATREQHLNCIEILLSHAFNKESDSTITTNEYDNILHYLSSSKRYNFNHKDQEDNVPQDDDDEDVDEDDENSNEPFHLLKNEDGETSFHLSLLNNLNNSINNSNNNKIIDTFLKYNSKFQDKINNSKNLNKTEQSLNNNNNSNNSSILKIISTFNHIHNNNNNSNSNNNLLQVNI